MFGTTAVDADSGSNGLVMYELIQDESAQNLFEIDSNSGVVVTRRNVKSVDPRFFTFQVNIRCSFLCLCYDLMKFCIIR